MDSSGIPIRNPEGYVDETAHAALSKVQKESDENDARVHNFIKAIKTLADQSGYDILTRIEIRDRKTGRFYR